MSIQSKLYTSRKTGKSVIRYYAAVWSAAESKTITGPYREFNCPITIPGGKVPEEYKTPPKSLIKALKIDEAELMQAIDNGKVEKRKTGQSFETVAKLWLESTKPPVFANSTWQGYKYYYDKYLLGVFGDKAINKITSIHIQKFVNIMNEQYSPETVNKMINVLTDIFNFAANPLKEIITSPVAGIKRSKVAKKAKETWNDAEIEYFLQLDSVRKSNYYEMLCISLLLGPRPGEVCGLLDTALISLPCKALMYDRGFDRYGEETEMKTDGSHRIVPIPDELYKRIDKKLMWKHNKHADDPEWGDNNFMFVSINGQPIKPNQYSKAFRRLCNSHNAELKRHEEKYKKLPDGSMYLPDIPLYGCRHSFATNAMRQTPNPALISSIMGNSIKTLLTSYVQVDVSAQKELLNNYAKDKIKKTV